MNVLIRTRYERVQHKFAKYIDDPDNTLCYWTVKGTPHKARRGDRIMFSDGNRVFAIGTVVGVEPGRIWFTPLEEVDMPNPKRPPIRGFTYV